MLKQIEHQRDGFGIRNVERHVGRKAFEIGGDPALADALGDGSAGGLHFAGGVKTV